MSKKTNHRDHDEYDTPWKEVLEIYFPDFLEFFLPEAYHGINWQRGYEFLDKELARITREAKIGDRRMDKLVQVWQRNGMEGLVLIHAEVQGDRKPALSPDMYTYHYRAFDLNRVPVVSLAILADNEMGWRPAAEFGYELWGTKLSYQFTVIKLLDYKKEDLERSSNPFAIITLANLHAKKTRHLPEERYRLKWQLIRSLHQRGFDKQKIINLFRFIDWVMHLPEEADKRFWKELANFEENKKMPYITSVERIGQQIGEKRGIKRGIKKGIKIGSQKAEAKTLTSLLQRRFGDVPPWAREKIAKAALPALDAWILRCLDAKSLDEVLSDDV